MNTKDKLRAAGVCIGYAAAAIYLATPLMTDSPSNYQLWLPAIAAFAVGVLTSSVAVAVAWLGHRFTAERDATKAKTDRETARRALLRDKLEQLVSLIDESRDALGVYGRYIGSIGIAAGVNSAQPESVPGAHGHADRALAIIALYFPALDDLALQLRAADLAHSKFVSAEVDAIATDIQNWSVQLRPTYGSRLGVSLAEFGKVRSAVATRARGMIAMELAP